MLRYDVHVCLVSNQATPNFIPVLDSRFRPREVILLVSPEMKKQAGWLSKALSAQVQRVTKHDINDAWSVAGIKDTLFKLVDARKSEGLALNVTGGTKLMTIAAQEVFRAKSLPIFYVHPATNQVVPIFSSEPPFSISIRVGLVDYLAIHGYREEARAGAEVPEGHALLAEEFVKEVERFASQLRKLNRLAGDAKVRSALNSGPVRRTNVCASYWTSSSVTNWPGLKGRAWFSRTKRHARLPTGAGWSCT